MAGIYVHVPFCKTRCIYCGFFSTTSSDLMPQYVEAVLRELHNRRDYLRGEEVETVYFGGGTPSQLPVESLKRIIDEIHIIYNKKEDAIYNKEEDFIYDEDIIYNNEQGFIYNKEEGERKKGKDGDCILLTGRKNFSNWGIFEQEITVEANPDDVTPEWLHSIREAGVNRLSMGVQSFDDSRLRFIRRRHTSAQAEQAVKMAQDAGFDNVSIDLMFGFPGQTLDEWKADLDKALSLGVQHLSAYSLMYEDGTALAKMLDDGKIEEVDEELSLAMFEALVDAATSAGFRHYEISNFALPGMESRHNSSYWHGVPYLGVGAGAHSYSGSQRCYNPDSLKDYLAGAQPVAEQLTDQERYDEYVFTRLRTAEGICLNDLEAAFGKDALNRLLADSAKHVKTGKLINENGSLRLSHEGIFISNDIMSDLMVADE